MRSGWPVGRRSRSRPDETCDESGAEPTDGARNRGQHQIKQRRLGEASCRPCKDSGDEADRKPGTQPGQCPGIDGGVAAAPGQLPRR